MVLKIKFYTEDKVLWLGLLKAFNDWTVFARRIMLQNTVKNIYLLFWGKINLIKFLTILLTYNNVTSETFKNWIHFKFYYVINLKEDNSLKQISFTQICTISILTINKITFPHM